MTACAFDLFPNWIDALLAYEGIGRGRSPSAALLAKVARAYKAASRVPSAPLSACPTEPLREHRAALLGRIVLHRDGERPLTPDKDDEPLPAGEPV